MTNQEAVRILNEQRNKFMDEWIDFGGVNEAYNLAISLLEKIVRCKDCIHWDKGHTEECDNSDSVCFHNGWCKPDWFCADGERRTE